MGTTLPDLSRAEFVARLPRPLPREIGEDVAERLWCHYRELRRWSPGLSLIGPGTADEVVERHYAESLLGVELIPPTTRRALDLGSGAGFPGWVLAAALPEVRFVLVEARQRKWAFLEAACRRAALSCLCLGARVGPALPTEIPPEIDLVTVRAVRLTERETRPLVDRLGPSGRFLVWAGSDEPDPPEGMERGRELALPGTTARRIVEWVRPGGERGSQR